MQRPLAWRHLARLNDLVTSASILHAVVERELYDCPQIAAAEQEERAITEELQALAQERGWTLPQSKPYQWQLMSSASVALPRILRVLAREVFELDELRRTTDDDEVSSLASRIHSSRLGLLRSLERTHPEFTLPGAK